MADSRLLTPGKKAQHTAKWARTMTKWLVTYSHRHGARWNVVDFGGKTKSESRGIVDLMAIRKDHSRSRPGLKRGDLLEIVFIQTKGGNSPLPTLNDKARLSILAKRYNAKVVLAKWRRREELIFFKLERSSWEETQANDIFK